MNGLIDRRWTVWTINQVAPSAIVEFFSHFRRFSLCHDGTVWGDNTPVRSKQCDVTNDHFTEYVTPDFRAQLQKVLKCFASPRDADTTLPSAICLRGSGRSSTWPKKLVERGVRLFRLAEVLSDRGGEARHETQSNL